MSTPADAPTDVQRVGVARDAPEGLPDEGQLLLRNDDQTPAVLIVVCRRDDHVASDTVHAEPRTTYGLPLPAGTGPIVVEVHTAETTATTSVAPNDRPPLFSYQDGSVLVARD
ncbi:hypothetical protein [Halorarius litoreus]|uniref:hypothetical protein n=1 Tax=Halorarius litoreus TaxID=2962676 RepID=UPI0020CF0E95|nr:hypothetical protein [Halorarius litoreus]